MYTQIATVEVPEEYVGPSVELLGKRRGQMIDMQGLGFVDIQFSALYNLLFKHFFLIKYIVTLKFLTIIFVFFCKHLTTHINIFCSTAIA